MQRKPSLGADLLVPALALGFAAYFFTSVADLAWEAKANGLLIGGILCLLALGQLARIALAVLRREATLGMEPLWQPREALGQRVGLVVITAVFIAALEWLGLTLALLLALFLALRLMGVRRPLPLALVPLCVALAAYGLFIAALDADLPRGPLELLLGALLFG